MFTFDNGHIVAICREIHEYPETGFNLPKTVAVVKRELDAMGIPYTEVYGKGSVVGYINPQNYRYQSGYGCLGHYGKGGFALQIQNRVKDACLRS